VTPPPNARQQILEILRSAARTPVAEIATRLELGEAEVAEHIAELEKSKTVLGYRTVVNHEKLENEPCLGIIEVNITPQRSVGYDEIAAQIYRFPEVILCYLVSGAYDLIVFVEGKNLKDVALFVSQKLATIEHVNRTATHFILRKYKEAGIILADEEKVQRLPITP